MKDSNLLRRIRIVILDINMIWLLFYVLLVNYTSGKIVKAKRAKEFIESLSFMPRQPWETEIATFFLLICLGFFMLYLRHKLKGSLAFIIYALLEVVTGICLFRLTDNNFSSIFLILATDILVFECKDIYKSVVLLLLLGLYVISDAGINIFGGERIPMGVYLSYYAESVRIPITAMANIVRCSTVILFTFNMVMLVRIAIEENERIRLLNEKLDKANEDLKAYAVTAEKMSETRERNRLAREIHDTLGHTLTGIISSLDGCLTLIDISPESTKKLLEKTRDVAKQGMVDVRRSVSALRPDVLENSTLTEALTGIVNDAVNTFQVRIDYKIDIEGTKLAEDEEDTVYRTVQESITNAIRHGKAKNITIEVVLKESRIIADIKDDGIGCAEIEKGFGLRHMQERIELLNGSLTYDGQNGFHVHSEIPVRWGQE